MTGLLPEIGTMDKGGLCYSIYSRLYRNFFTAQDEGTVAEGDTISVRLHNTAYNFASAIAGSVTGEAGGETGGILLDCLKKTGGDMRGTLRANCGFEAGVENTRILHVYGQENEKGVEISGDLKIGGRNFYLGGKQVLSYEGSTFTTRLESARIHFGESQVCSTGEMIIGTDKESGVLLAPALIQVGGKNVYHEGNANRESVSWKMLDAQVAGKLEVAGAVVLDGILTAGHGVNLGAEGKTVLSIASDTAELSGFLSFRQGCGIRIAGLPVLARLAAGAIQLAAPEGDLLFGNEATHKIRLLSGLWDMDGDVQLVGRYGAACFPASLTVRHNYGADLLTSYHTEEGDEGIIIHKRLRFESGAGVFLYGKNGNLFFASQVERIESGEGKTTSYPHEASLGFGTSTSLYQPQDRHSDSFVIHTSADFFRFGKPVEAAGHIGIDASLTRLTDRALFLGEGSCLLATAGGIRHYGNACFMDGIGSESFSSGFAGSGWAVLRNRTTGNVQATFDEVVVRKKMRVYELEVQKDYATNGSLWITDSCSGDTVTAL